MQPEGELKWSPAGTSKVDAQAEFQAKTNVTYNHYKSVHQDSCQKALSAARDAHQQLLAAAALLEKNIECLCLSISHWQS